MSTPKRDRAAAYGAAPTGVAIGSDHAGFELKGKIIAYLKAQYPNVPVRDCGAFSEDRVDYPDVAKEVCQAVLANSPYNRGILLDGAGVASGIAANKFNGIRCGVVHDHFSTSMGRKHNDVNVIALGGKTLGIEAAKEIVDVFMKCEFEGERHIPRLTKLAEIEDTQGVSRGGGYRSEVLFADMNGGGRRSTNAAINSPFKLPN
jgi:ribose 5-phosphate isomerase B